jgi:hypothetical protein
LVITWLFTATFRINVIHAMLCIDTLFSCPASSRCPAACFTVTIRSTSSAL